MARLLRLPPFPRLRRERRSARPAAPAGGRAGPGAGEGGALLWQRLVIADPGRGSADGRGAGDLRSFAEEIIAERERRLWFFPRGIFVETAWEILLSLYASEANRHSIASLAGAASTSFSLTERWVRFLEAEGLVTTAVDGPSGAGRINVSLTQCGLGALDLYLSDRLLRMPAPERTGRPPVFESRHRLVIVFAAGFALALATVTAFAIT